MRIFILIIVIALSFIGCEKKTEENNVKTSSPKITNQLSNPIISKELKSALDKFIEFADKNAKHKNIKSILIEFDDIGKRFVLFSAYYRYYDYKNCNGYFNYKGKVISFYGLKLKYTKQFIDSNQLIHVDEIPGLKHDYSEDENGSVFDRDYSIDDKGYLTLLLKA